MATEQAQQPPAATATRLQQSTAAIAASLPTETLAQILNSSLEGLDLSDRQKERMRFARVCVSWYSAVEVGRELVVKDTKVAERRAKSLMRGSAERRDRIRSLSIIVETSGAGRGKRIAGLVSACSHVETLQLLGIGPSLGNWSCYLGKPLTQALKSLSHLKSFEINSSSRVQLGRPELFKMLAILPHVTTLLIPTISTYTWRDGDTTTAPSASLYELHLPLENGHSNLTLDDLLKSSKSTLRHLNLGGRVTTAASLAQLAPEIKTSLETVAPQLVTLKAVLDFVWHGGFSLPYTASDFLLSALAALRDVKDSELALGILGFPFATVLSLLQPLLHLHTLSIGLSELGAHAPQAPFSQLTSQAAIDFIDGAVSLKSLTLPRQMKDVWTKNELDRVKAAAQKRDVRFALE